MTQYYLISTCQFGYPQPEDDYAQQVYSFESACPTCEIGKEQLAEFRFNSDSAPKENDFTGLNWVFDQIFVRQRVKNILEEHHVSGIEFSQPLHHKKGEKIPQFYQLRINTILPPAIINNDLKMEICQYPKDKKIAAFLEANGSTLVKGPFCGRSKFNFPQGQPFRFKKRAFEGQPDFVRTNEWFGSGGSARRPILVSSRIKELIELNQFKGAQFEPVELA